VVLFATHTLAPLSPTRAHRKQERCCPFKHAGVPQSAPSASSSSPSPRILPTKHAPPPLIMLLLLLLALSRAQVGQKAAPIITSSRLLLLAVAVAIVLV
jgi:hypothetical protein